MFKFKDLFDVLVCEGVLSEDNLVQLGRFVERWNVSQYDAVVDTNLLTEARLLDILSKTLSLKRLRSLSGYTACLECVKTFPREQAERGGFIILAESTSVKRFVCADPFTIDASFSKFQENTASADGLAEVEIALSTKSEISKKVIVSYGSYTLANTIETQLDPKEKR